jgi:undecaprenyl-diphosphatase
MDIFELIKAAIIGIVEGVTEWLPISSTGHMILVDEFLPLSVSPEFLKMFLVIIQLGAILAVILLYFKRLNPFASSKSTAERRHTWGIWGKVVIGCIPAAVIGFLLDDWADEHFYNAITVAIMLVVYGVAYIVVERIKGQPESQRIGDHSKSSTTKTTTAKAEVTNVNDLSILKVLGIGAFQCLAIIPGTSRSGSTILGGRILGVSRETAAEFSFFLAIPVMFGWSLLKVIKSLALDHLSPTLTEWGVFIVGIVVAFVVSIFAIKFLMSYIKKHSFEVFGWYRIALGVIVLAFFALTGQLL